VETRNVVLVVYAAVLGWYLHSWWREEKERIAWRAAETARESLALYANLRQPAEASGSSPAST